MSAKWRQNIDELAFVVDDLAPRAVCWQQPASGGSVDDLRRRTGTQAVWLRHDATGDGSYEAFLRGSPATDPDLPVDPDRAVLAL